MSSSRRTSPQMRDDAARWVVARRAGRTVTQIAGAEGCGLAGHVGSGPFPMFYRASQDDRADWVQQRRAGVSPAQIAAAAAVTVSAATVARATAPWGRFPSSLPPSPPRWSPADAARWTALRRARVPMSRIAAPENPSPTDDSPNDSPTDGRAGGPAGREVRVTVALVKAATSGAGPFPSPLLGPPGLIGVRAVAAMAGLSQPTIAHRLARGELPPPQVVTASGRALWDPDDITRWLQRLQLPQCPVCGAKATRQDRHQTLRHGRDPS